MSQVKSLRCRASALEFLYESDQFRTHSNNNVRIADSFVWRFVFARAAVKGFSDDFFYTDAISEQAAMWIRGQEASRPLFLYSAFFAPDYPLQAPQKVIDQVAGNWSIAASPNNGNSTICRMTAPKSTTSLRTIQTW